MLEQGFIKESCSPWMVPALFVPKKSGEICLCIDYGELNKCTVKHAYPFPLVDEIKDRLSDCSIFTTLDLHSGYYQLPVHPADVQKTAFCSGPGMGLYQFKQMPFGLTPMSPLDVLCSTFQKSRAAQAAPIKFLIALAMQDSI